MRRIVLIAVCLVAASCKKDGPATDDGAKAGAKGDASAEAGDNEGAEVQSDLPGAEAILDKAVEAVGGREKLDAIDSFYFAGTITILGQNIGGDSQTWWKDGDFYSEQHMAGIGQIRAGKQGDTIWSDDPINGLRKLEGAEAEQNMWASSLMLAADWKRYFKTAKTTAEREIDGNKAYEVELESDSGSKVVLTFDDETGLQVAQRFEQVTPMGNMPVEVEMKDYREVDGVKIAFEQVTDASLAKATQTLTEVDFNPEIDTSKFAMPASGTDVVDKKTMMPFGPDGKPGRPVPEKD